MNTFITSPAPHVHGGDSVRKNMFFVILALVPAYVVSVFEFGWGALITAAISVAACVLTEWLIGRFVLKEQRQTIGDLSAVLTGLLLAFNLPSSLDWWIVLIGRSCVPVDFFPCADDHLAVGKGFCNELSGCRDGCYPALLPQAHGKDRRPERDGELAGAARRVLGRDGR